MWSRWKKKRRRKRSRKGVKVGPIASTQERNRGRRKTLLEGGLSSQLVTVQKQVNAKIKINVHVHVLV